LLLFPTWVSGVGVPSRPRVCVGRESLPVVGLSRRESATRRDGRHAALSEARWDDEAFAKLCRRLCLSVGCVFRVVNAQLDRLYAADSSIQPTIFFQRDSRLMHEMAIRLRSDAIDVKTLTILHQHLGCATIDPRRVWGADGALLLTIHSHTHHARGLPSCPHARLHRGRLPRLRMASTSHRRCFVHLGPVRGDSDTESVSL